MFKALGLLVAIYTVWSAMQGRVYARSGVWGRTITRAEQPAYFWTVIGIYALLALALLTVF